MGSTLIYNETPDGFYVKGVRFVQLNGEDNNIKTNLDQVVVIKPPSFLKNYDNILKNLPTKNVVEIGIAQGGSLIYFALAFPHLNFVGLDIRSPDQGVLDKIEKLGLSNRIKLFYNIDQSNASVIKKIINTSFNGESVGAIIDDASHWYELSKMTFEASFLHLAIGGTYCLEDWSWAHEPGPMQNNVWKDKLSLANLLFEIIMAQASNYKLIRNIDINHSVAFIERGESDLNTLKLENLILNRGKRLTYI